MTVASPSPPESMDWTAPLHVQPHDPDDVPYANRARRLCGGFDRCLLQTLDFRARLLQFQSRPLDGLVVDRLAAGRVPRQRRLRSTELPSGVLELPRHLRPHVRQHVLTAGLDVPNLVVERLLGGLRLALRQLGLLEHGLLSCIRCP